MSEVVPSRTDQGNITKFLITSNKNKKKRDITGSIVDLYYQESIFDTSVRLQISVSDAGYKEIDKKTGLGKGKSQNFIEELNLAGGEKAEIAFEDSCDRTRRLTMYVNTITPFKESTTDLAAMISFVSKEYLDNEQTAIRKRFTGKISETIQKIVSTTPTAQGKNEEILKEEFDTLYKQWKNCINKSKSKKAPKLVHEDGTMSFRVIRDLFDEDNIDVKKE